MDEAWLVICLGLGSTACSWKRSKRTLALMVLEVRVLELEEARYGGSTEFCWANLQTLLLASLGEGSWGRVLVL